MVTPVEDMRISHQGQKDNLEDLVVIKMENLTRGATAPALEYSIS